MSMPICFDRVLRSARRFDASLMAARLALVELDHLVNERQLRVLKFFADVLPNELGVFTDESNVNHIVSVSSMF